MAAIFGLFGCFKASVVSVKLTRMDAAVESPGSSSTQFWATDRAGLSYRAFPADSRRAGGLLEELDVVVAFDGDLHRRKELQESLGITAGDPAACDSEIICAAYRKDGPDGFAGLHGCFAFALYERAANRMFLVRSVSPGGPLYYAGTPERCAFGSAPRGLFASEFAGRAPNLEEISRVMLRRVPHTKSTVFRDLSSVAPGETVCLSDAGFSSVHFWRPRRRDTLRLTSPSACAEAFQHLFGEVVADYIPDDAPASVMLSGGLDSAALAAAAVRCLSPGFPKLLAFTEVPACDPVLEENSRWYASEEPLVRALADTYSQLDLHLTRSPQTSLLHGIRQYFDASEYPFPNALNRLMYESILRLARTCGSRTALTGIPGNLTISWDGRFLLANLIRKFRLKSFLREFRPANAASRSGSLLSTAARAFYHASPGWVRRSASRWRGGEQNEFDRQPFRREFLLKHRDLLAERPARDAARLQILASDYSLPSVRFGLECLYGVRLRDVPGDRRLIDFCLSIPDEQFVAGGISRSLLRRAMHRTLPDAILSNQRRGLQGADWPERLKRSAGALLAELKDIGKANLVREVLDMNILTEHIAQVANSGDRRALHSGMRPVIERGVMLAAYLAWLEGSM